MYEPDRRRYFRIEDSVWLSFRSVGDNEHLAPPENANNVHISVVDVLKSLDEELLSGLSTLWQNSPAIASVLGLINKKIDIIASEANLDYSDIQHPDEKQTEVNLSACGIAFDTRQRLDAGQRLEINFRLIPTNIRIPVIGHVVAVERNGEDRDFPYFLRVNFDEIERASQEQLIQHIVRRQSSQLAEQRHVNSESGM